MLDCDQVLTAEPDNPKGKLMFLLCLIVCAYFIRVLVCMPQPCTERPLLVITWVN